MDIITVVRHKGDLEKLALLHSVQCYEIRILIFQTPRSVVYLNIVWRAGWHYYTKCKCILIKSSIMSEQNFSSHPLCLNINTIWHQEARGGSWELRSNIQIFLPPRFVSSLGISTQETSQTLAVTVPHSVIESEIYLLNNTNWNYWRRSDLVILFSVWSALWLVLSKTYKTC